MSTAFILNSVLVGSVCRSLWSAEALWPTSLLYNVDICFTSTLGSCLCTLVYEGSSQWPTIVEMVVAVKRLYVQLCMVIRCCYDDLWVAVVSGNCSLNEGLYSVSHETIVYMCSTYVYIYFLSRRSGCGTLQSKTHDHLLGRGNMQ